MAMTIFDTYHAVISANMSSAGDEDLHNTQTAYKSAENNSILTTTAAVTDTISTETLLSMIRQWVHLAILILGVITDPLVIYILHKRKVGGLTTRITLSFLAVADIGCLLTNFFLSVVIMTNPNWFQVYSTDSSCAIGDMLLSVILTCSPWYIVIAALERATAVYFPFKIQKIFTFRRVVIGCCLMPVFWTLVYLWTIANIQAYTAENGVVRCQGKPEKEREYNSGYLFWATMYIFVPVALIFALNSAIALKITSIQRTRTELSSAYQRTSNSIRRGTKMVMAASFIFLILMVPRGIVFLIRAMDGEGDPSIENSDIDAIIDTTAWFLQYLNHSINLFIYMVFLKKFRICSSGRCCVKYGHNSERDNCANLNIPSTTTRRLSPAGLPVPLDKPEDKISP